MAIKPTIYKLRIALSDLERNYYDSLSLTIAQHPSETNERMMARVMAYVINAQDRLTFCKGLSAVEEPDIWLRTLDDQIALWIDVGEPSVDRIKKASRVAEQVKVYSFNTKSGAWWQLNQRAFSSVDACIYRLDWHGIKMWAGYLDRTMDMSVTITGDSAYVSTSNGECEVTWEPLQIAKDTMKIKR